jgi:inner membrane protein involved in colicin E2 resistance
MPSNQQFRRFDGKFGISLICLFAVGLVVGFLYNNWTVIETWVPYVLTGVFILLFYRLVVAVEHLTYDN